MKVEFFRRKALGFKEGLYLRAEYIGNRTVSLPLYPRMTEEDAKEVIQAVEKALFMAAGSHTESLARTALEPPYHR